jgi:hypothetical protein
MKEKMNMKIVVLVISRKCGLIFFHFPVMTRTRFVLSLIMLIAFSVFLFQWYNPDQETMMLARCAIENITYPRATEVLLFNPLDPASPRRHHPIFNSFKRWKGAYDPNYIIDWLGIETKYEWDCIDDPKSTMHYSIIQPSRRIPCEIHEQQRQFGGIIDGEMPLLDDEYEEMIDVLMAVNRTPSHFVMVELGARYGTWGVRALKAWHQLRGSSAPATFVGVESDALFFSWMQHHVNHNGMREESVLLHQSARQEKNYTLMDIAEKAGIAHIHYLDSDIQATEATFFDDQRTLEWMEDHVDVVHIGTHSNEIHNHLKRIFDSRKWVYFFGYPLGYRSPSGKSCDDYLVNSLQTRSECMTNSPYGKMYVRDGMLSYGNPKLFSLKSPSPY